MPPDPFSGGWFRNPAWSRKNGFSATNKCLWNFSRSKFFMLYNLKSEHVGTFSTSLTSSHVIWSILAKFSFLVKFGILSVHNGFSRSWTNFQGYWYMYRSSRKTKPKKSNERSFKGLPLECLIAADHDCKAVKLCGGVLLELQVGSQHIAQFKWRPSGPNSFSWESVLEKWNLYWYVTLRNRLIRQTKGFLLWCKPNCRQTWGLRTAGILHRWACMLSFDFF